MWLAFGVAIEDLVSPPASGTRPYVLAYVDVSIAYAMYRKALDAGVGKWTYLQENMIFEKDLSGKIRF